MASMWCTGLVRPGCSATTGSMPDRRQPRSGTRQTVGVVGESGCGKSTLAKIIVGLQRPTEGTVRYNGRALWEMRPAERARDFGSNVGMIFQDPTTR